MANWEKPQKIKDFCSTEEQDNIFNHEHLSDVLSRMITKLDDFESRITALEPRKK